MTRPFRRGAPPPHPNLPLLSPTEFARSFEAERVRTERTGSVFAVVTVALREARRGEVRRMIEVLQGAARIYDSLGTIGDATAGTGEIDVRETLLAAGFSRSGSASEASIRRLEERLAELGSRGVDMVLDSTPQP